MADDPRPLVWSGVLDQRYKCEVRRVTPYRGELLMWDGAEKLLSQEVVLSYDARFGPDIGDVADWTLACMERVDNAAAQG